MYPAYTTNLTIILLSANTHNLKRERGREKTIKIENLKLQEKENKLKKSNHRKNTFSLLYCALSNVVEVKRMIFSNIWWNDTSWQPVACSESILWASIFQTLFVKVKVKSQSQSQKSQVNRVVILWACFVQSFLWLESWEIILPKQLNLWLMKNVEDEKIVPVLELWNYSCLNLNCIWKILKNQENEKLHMCFSSIPDQNIYWKV